MRIFFILSLLFLIPFTAEASLTLSKNGITSDSSLTIRTTSGLIHGETAGDVLTFAGTVSGASPLLFEGATENDFELTFAITDPTADRTITLPNVSGTVVTTGNLMDITALGTVASGIWNGGTIAIANGGTGAITAGDALTNFGISSFAQTVLDDPSATAIRATIGAGTGNGDLLASNNLSDITPDTARTNLGLAIGTDVEAFDAALLSIAGLTTTADTMLYATASDTYATAVLTPFARTILDDANAASVRATLGVGTGNGDLLAVNNLSDLASASTARTNLGLAIGTDVEAFDAGLFSIAGLTTAADKMIYTMASDVYATTDLSSFARTLLDDTSAAAVRATLGAGTGNGDLLASNNLSDITPVTARTNLGLGSLATQSASSASITGGMVTGLTDFAIRSTGTGAFDLSLTNTENLTAGRALTLKLNDAARTIDLNGHLTIAGALSTSGANSLTFTTTGATNVTLPTSGTLLSAVLTDNVVDALDLQESTNNYLNINTTNSAEQITIGNTTLGTRIVLNDELISHIDGGAYFGRVGLREQHFGLKNVGATWVARDSNRAWFAVGVSSDARYQTAVTNADQIYTSSDYGVTWAARDSARAWRSVSLSSDGKYQSAVDIGGQIYTSSDYGVTWTARDSTRNWYGTSVSSDGKYQTAVGGSTQIYTSSDYGVTWTARDSARNWVGASISSDGKYQTAVVNGGQIYTSSNYGVSWTARDSTRSRASSVAISSDGKYQTTLVSPGQIYTSSDYGITWTARESSRDWMSVAISSDGKYQTAVVLNGRIYTSVATSYVPGGSIGVGDDYGLQLGTDTDAELIYDETTDDRVELAGTGASLWVEDRLSLGRQSFAVTDDGIANDTLTPTASYVEVTQNATANAGTPNIVLNEGSAKEGDMLTIIRIDSTAGDVTITESDGVNEQAGTVTLNTAEFDSVTYMYTGTTWVQVSASDNG